MSLTDAEGIAIVARLLEMGFDGSSYDSDDAAVHPKCSQCEALVINGTACHESGCANIPRQPTLFGDDDEWPYVDIDGSDDE
jgi:hypothetical protein